MLVVTCEVTIKPGCEGEYLEKVKNLLDACRNHSGLLLYSIMRNAREADKFCWLEFWESGDALQQHADSRELSEWRKIKDKYVLDSKIETWHFADIVASGLLKDFFASGDIR